MSTRRYSARTARAVSLAFAAGVAVMLALAANATAGTLWLKTCGSYGRGILALRQPPAGIAVTSGCPGKPITIQSRGTAAAGARGQVQATAPPGVSIVHFWIDNYDLGVSGVNDRTGFGGGFYWAGGGAGARDGMTGYSSPVLNSRYVGWQIVCGFRRCTNTGAAIDVYDFNIQAVENSGPGLIATTALWYARGWIRGSWPLGFSGQDVSGVCDLTATVAGQSIQGPMSGKDPTQWTQCHTRGFSSTINTADYPNGAVPMSIHAENAADVWSSAAKSLAIDNQPVSIQISGPTDVPTTAGVQRVNATAAAGVSGVSGIGCSLDDAQWRWRPQASVSVPISGVGVHRLRCSAANNARDASGHVATSRPATWTLRVRRPSVSALSFHRVVGGLRCHRSRARIRVAARWVRAHRGRRTVRVKRAAHVRVVRVVRCRPRMVRRRVRVRGRWRARRVAVLPHTAHVSKRVRYGAGTTVSGWLGTSRGTALGGQRVRILTAPDNGLRRFRRARVVRTGPDGRWRARLRAGPSRLVRAVYDGASTVEPASSGAVRIVVPASIALRSVRPRHARWGQRITIPGRLGGGFLPRAGERVDVWLRYQGGVADIANILVTGRGRFKVGYRFSRGRGTVRYPVWVSTTADSAYPYAPARSRRTLVRVGP